MSEKEKELEEKVKNLTKAVETLVELETMRTKLEIAKMEKQSQIKATEQEQSETRTIREREERLEAEEDLREAHLANIVILGIKKDVLPRGTAKSIEKE